MGVVTEMPIFPSVSLILVRRALSNLSEQLNLVDAGFLFVVERLAVDLPDRIVTSEDYLGPAAIFREGQLTTIRRINANAPS